jgi:2,4-dienoyl-CoA reductase-like NADH-dependent reductase (Old Yellow Enzyme family)/thioredoxin reductase
VTETRFPALLSPYRMRGLELRNRIVMGGHGTRFTDHGAHLPSQQQIDYLADRARGGAAMMILGATMIHPTGLATAGVYEVWSDDSIPVYARIAEAVHEHGMAIFGQLSHLGRQGNTFTAQRELWAPSAIADPASRVVPHALRRREIDEVVDLHRAAALRFLKAGFDGIEVYLAHGYLMCGFLSRFSNHREDEYGGSLENRMRLPLRVIRAVREEVGGDVPIGIRVSGDEFAPDGLTLPETQEIGEAILAEGSIDYVSVSQSNYTSTETMIPDMSFERAPFTYLARGIREVAAGVPVMTVARLVTPEKCEELLTDGTADFVVLVRPLIADPEFPNKVREGRRAEIRECISCNVGCRGGPTRGLPIACLVNPAVGHEREAGIGRLGLAARARRVVVVGGGPGGLKAAETAALRGHEVVLLERAAELGGQVLVAAAAMPYRDEFANATRFLEREVERLGVDVRCGVEADAALVRSLNPDAVVVATGSTPGRPAVPGADLPHVHTAHDAILRGVEGHKVVVVDSGEADWRCLTTAERLAADGHAVRIVSPVPVGAELDHFSRIPLIRRLRRAGVAFSESTTLCSIEPGSVTVRDSWTGEEELLAADAVVVAWFGVARDGLAHALEDDDGHDVHLVGDCLAPRRAIDAIWDGFRVGRAL